MRYFLFLLFLLLASKKNVSGQDFSYGKVTAADFESTNIDANAVVLHEFGRARIEFNSIKKELVLRNYFHTKVLIITKDGFDKANFTLTLYRDGSSKEFIEDIKGTTYNLAEGKITETGLQKSNILTEKSSESVNYTKIAFPDVKEGSIIELRYAIESPFLYNLQTWDFESTIPKLHSEFVTEIPSICIYNVKLKGSNALTSHSALPYDTKIATNTNDITGTQTTYVMKNIPAFIEEDYMTATHNFTSQLSFELASFSIPFGPSYNYTRSWADVDKTLKNSEYFGKELKRKNLFKEIIPTITTAQMSDYEKANAVYEYIRQNIKWNRKTGVFTDNGVKKAMEERNGNVTDINIALICALQAAGLEADPVILSTRSNGFPSFFQAALSDYNYTIASIQIGEDSFLLDASDVNTSFGLIPLHCINYQGRKITKDESSWIDLKASLPSRVTYVYEGTLAEDGTTEGQLQISYFGYAASNKREEIKKFNSQDEYFEDYSEKAVQFKILENKIEHLDNPNFSLIESYTIEAPNFANLHDGKITFNPFIVGRVNKNPFNLDERTYPVDLGSNIENLFDIKLKVPEGYKLSDKFKNINMALPNRDARYVYNIKEDNGMIIIQVFSSINKPLFLPEEYLDLKEFFSRIIQSQKIDIELQKS